MDFRTVRPILRLAAPCLVLAAVSVVVLAPAPAYDPWMWLLWGHEVAHGTLSTADGPAFKPLTVALCALLTPLGDDAAPVVWVVVARAAALAAVGLAFLLARRVAGVVAGVLAAVAVALCGAFPRYAATGDVTGLLLALVFGGLLAWRSGRTGLAIACALAAGLLRVETWPFLAVGAVWLWRSSPRLRPALLAAAVAVPAAWFVPEWLGSGDALRSGDRARVPNPGQPALADVPFLASLGDALALPLWPLLLAAAATSAPGLASSRTRLAASRTRLAWLLIGVGGAWVVVVAAMAQAGFSGEARYALPGAALVAVGGALGVAALPRAIVVAACVLVAVAAVPRIIDLGALHDAQDHQWALAQDLDDAIAAAGGRAAVRRCGTAYTGPLRGPLLAYALDVRKRDVEPDADLARPPGTVLRSRRLAGEPLTPAISGFGRERPVGVWVVARRCS